ncbi:hypothetical protein B0T11DRAFT_15938 [Plectosphaerella cucumerina]|uniref:Uncharacterized protein n=1 Tax=Plectosphaerella cucumerina TaxID=40658 RepID=A0A8K0X8N9_9PEZI|nr:hypothetical protein B0T11DRAFT_15938 [Plectosphaerella cucumerina]
MVLSGLPALLRPVTPIQVIHEARPAPRRLQLASQPRPACLRQRPTDKRLEHPASPARQSRPRSTRLLYSSSRLLPSGWFPRSFKPPISSHRIPSRLVSFGAGRSVSRSGPARPLAPPHRPPPPPPFPHSAISLTFSPPSFVTRPPGCCVCVCPVSVPVKSACVCVCVCVSVLRCVGRPPQLDRLVPGPESETSIRGPLTY